MEIVEHVDRLVFQMCQCESRITMCETLVNELNELINKQSKNRKRYRRFI